MEFPEFTLPVSRDNRGRGKPGILVAFEGKIFMNHFDYLRILLKHLLEYRYKPGTRRSLKIAEHRDHHRRIHSAFERTQGANLLDKVQT